MGKKAAEKPSPEESVIETEKTKERERKMRYIDPDLVAIPGEDIYDKTHPLYDPSSPTEVTQEDIDSVISVGGVKKPIITFPEFLNKPGRKVTADGRWRARVCRAIKHRKLAGREVWELPYVSENLTVDEALDLMVVLNEAKNVRGAIAKGVYAEKLIAGGRTVKRTAELMHATEVAVAGWRRCSKAVEPLKELNRSGVLTDSALSELAKMSEEDQRERAEAMTSGKKPAPTARESKAEAGAQTGNGSGIVPPSKKEIRRAIPHMPKQAREIAFWILGDKLVPEVPFWEDVQRKVGEEVSSGKRKGAKTDDATDATAPTTDNEEQETEAA